MTGNFQDYELMYWIALGTNLLCLSYLYMGACDACDELSDMGEGRNESDNVSIGYSAGASFISFFVGILLPIGVFLEQFGFVENAHFEVFLGSPPAGFFFPLLFCVFFLIVWPCFELLLRKMARAKCSRVRFYPFVWVK